LHPLREKNEALVHAYKAARLEKNKEKHITRPWQPDGPATTSKS
jgi:hypothetical protein